MKGNRVLTLEHIKYIVLWATNDCNLRCKYCYAHGGEKKDYMSFEAAKRAVELPRGSFKLQIAGGEPFMNFSLIKEIHDYLKMHKPRTRMQLQTNGMMIDGKIAKEIKEMNIGIGVSLDGPFEINESLRGGTIEAINGIKALGAYGIMTNLNCVVTSASIEKLDELVDLAFYLGNIGGIGLDLLRETGRAESSGIKKASPGQVVENLWKAWRRTEELYRLTGKKVAIREIEDAKKRIHEIQGCNDYCYAVSGSSMVVLPDGDLYPCGSLVRKKAYYMGNIYHECTYREVKLDIERPESCNSCKYGKICMGACPARSIINSDGRGFTKEDCALRKTAFEIAEKEYKRCYN